uniref:chitinase n=1 Tax=Bionectria ochroleuca TaxID=29856 RepID=A2SW12_BIOOC|nr:58 kDa endochitinase [Clonostachys rosea]
MLTASLFIALLAPVALAEQADLRPRGCPDGTVTTIITSLTTTTQPARSAAPIPPKSAQKLPCPCDSSSYDLPNYDYYSPPGQTSSQNSVRPGVIFSTSTARATPGTPGYSPGPQTPLGYAPSGVRSGFITSTVPSPTSSRIITTPVSSKPSTTPTPTPTPLPPPVSGPKNMLYFGAWSIYGQKFRPQDMSVNKVSHILYAFGDIGSDGSVISADPWADYQIRYSGDSQESSGSNAYGNVKQLYLLKQKYRNLKTLLSIGGYTYSQQGKFQAAANTAAGRQRFASTAVQLMSDWGFDGLDIDWEYPENQADSNNFVLLLQAAGQPSTTGPEKYKLLNMKAMDQYVDTWNLMAYDYAGSWDTTTGHAANLFYSSANPQSTKFNTDQAVKDYIKGGVSPSKIVLGMPLYGRSFLNTVAQVGQPYQGVASNTGSDPGVWLYRDLPRQGAQVKIDTQAGAAWSYDATTKELVSFDNVPVGLMKADYIRKQGLGGAMFWEAAGDKTGGESLVGAVGNAMGSLELSNNMLDYPQSRYSNIRNKMKV